MAKNDTYLEEAFRKAFESHEMDVRPEVWSAIEGSITHGAGASAGGGAVLGKAAAVVGFAGLITAATIAEINYHSVDVSIQSAPVEQQFNVEVEVSEPESTVAAYETTTSDPSVSDAETPVTQIDERTSEAANEEVADVITDGDAIDDTPQQGMEEGSALDQEEISEPLAGEDDGGTDQESGAIESGNDRDALPQPQPAVKDEETSSSAAPTKSELAYFSHPAKQIITPNGDDRNDYLLIEGYGFKDFTLIVMAQNGMPVFDSKDPNVRWNGTDKMGNALPAGQYFYKIMAVGDDDLPYEAPNAKGSVQIIR